MTLLLDSIYIVKLTLHNHAILRNFWLQKKGNTIPLIIGMAFGLFDISHLATILDGGGAVKNNESPSSATVTLVFQSLF